MSTIQEYVVDPKTYHGKWILDVYCTVYDILLNTNVTEENIQSIYDNNVGYHSDTILRGVGECTKTPALLLEKILMYSSSRDDEEDILKILFNNPNLPKYLQSEISDRLNHINTCPYS